VATHIDITQRKAAEEEIRGLAYYDSLTQQPNRRLFLDRLRHAIALHGRNRRCGALFFIDLDHFKTLNDSLGHSLGDRLLQQVAGRLAALVREGDTVARLGGDEFVVICESLAASVEEAAKASEAIGSKILEGLRRPYSLDGHEYTSTASIGITLFGPTGQSVEELLKQADLAMYQAKAAGRNRLRFFDPRMQQALTAHLHMERDLRDALREGQLQAHFQPQVRSDGQTIGAEVLVRWMHPRRGLIYPGEFIALAEDTGLILPLGHWVLELACAQLARWAHEPGLAHLTLAVNVSGQQMYQPEFVEQVLGALQRSGAAPQRLVLELTESLLMSNIEDVIAKMNALDARGVGFALDDFGTGYSSLAYLKRLPLRCLKIDYSFVKDILSNPNDAAIAQTVIGLTKILGLQVAAEGVESREQRDFLMRNGCSVY
jgi:diguanylate cyclase (GGDEF)-like protein